MKRRSFLGALAAIIAAPKVLAAKVRDTAPFLPQFWHHGLQDGDPVFVMPDLSGNGNDGLLAHYSAKTPVYREKLPLAQESKPS